MSPPNTDLAEVKETQPIAKLDQNGYDELSGLIDLTQGKDESEESSYSDEVEDFRWNGTSLRAKRIQQSEGNEHPIEQQPEHQVEPIVNGVDKTGSEHHTEPIVACISNIEMKERDSKLSNGVTKKSVAPTNTFEQWRTKLEPVMQEHIDQLKRHELLHLNRENQRNMAIGLRDRLEVELENKKAACEELQQAVGHANGLIKRVEQWCKESPAGEVEFSDKLVAQAKEHADEKNKILKEAWDSVDFIAKELALSQGQTADAEAELAQAEVDLGQWLDTRDAVTTLILKCKRP